MKLKVTAAILIISLLIATFCACSNNDATTDDAGKTDAITQDADQGQDTTAQATEKNDAEKDDVPDYNVIYSGTLDKFAALFTSDSSDDFTGSVGVTEMINMRGAEEAADCIGYSIKDLSGDGIPELIIGFIDSNNEGGEVLALYTYKDEAPVLVFEGMTKSAYFLMNDGDLLYIGKNSAYSSIFASYSLSEDCSLVCNGYWFSDIKDDSSEEIGYYHNTTGEFDKAASEELNVTEDQFFANQSTLIDKKTTTPLTPFSAF